MSGPTRYLELRCRHCGRREVFGPAAMADRLRKAGKLRAGRRPELGILYELFRGAAEGWACRQCGKVGLAVADASDEAQWPGPVPCAACGKPIPPERLEAVPGARLCAACQREGELGRPMQERDHCPRCGAPLEVRVAERGGLTRYILACTGNPPCDLS